MLKLIDIFFIMPRVNYSGRQKYQTNLGGFMTLIMVTLAILLSLGFAENLIFHKNPFTKTRQNNMFTYAKIMFRPSLL